ncbi:MAG: glycosyltransferase [Ignavibacteria bacterium]|nr:glycosyltransferase [Ignavibacteria bacterium]
MNEYISVVMSVYNEEKYISAAIKSILNQTYPYFEFIIINDGSTDNSESIIKSFKDERIVYKKIEKVNFSKALNEGLNIAKYNYVARMDADDISLPDRFEKQIKFMVENPDVQVLSSGYALFKNKIISHIHKLPQNDRDIKEQLNYSGSVCHAGSIYSKNYILQFGGYNESLDMLEDMDLWLRIRKETKFHNLDEVLYLIRIKENSMTSKESLKPKQFFRDIYLKHFDKNYYSDYAKSDEDYAILLYKFSNKNEFREYVLNKKILFSPKIFLLYIWSFLPGKISSKNIVDWFKWKLINVRTVFDKNKKKYEELLINLEEQDE